MARGIEEKVEFHRVEHTGRERRQRPQPPLECLGGVGRARERGSLRIWLRARIAGGVGLRIRCSRGLKRRMRKGPVTGEGVDCLYALISQVAQARYRGKECLRGS